MLAQWASLLRHDSHLNVLKLLLFVVPLGLDTFAVSAALGVAGLPARDRLRVSLLFSCFEAAMPIVGVFLGRALGGAIGHAADYVAAAILAAVGTWMLVEDDEDRVANVGGLRGPALLGLGLSVSLDELALGFSIGLLHLNLWLAVILLGVQAFVFAQLGLRFGARVRISVRERAERLAGVALLGLALLFLIERAS